MEAEKEIEELKYKKLLTLDRHELCKILEKQGIEVFDVDTTEQLRDTLKELMRKGMDLYE